MMSETSRAVPKRRWRPILFTTLRVTLLVSIVGGGGWLAWWWARYPKAPNLQEAPLADCTAFMGSSDFNRMTHRDRTRFALGIVDKLKDKSFADLVATGMQKDPTRKAAAENVNKLDKDERDRIGSAFMQLFLDKFYQQSATKRTTYLMGLVLMQKTGGGSAAARKFGIPSVDEFKKRLADFITRQPAHAQAQIGQFMLDIGKEQRAMGVKPW